MYDAVGLRGAREWGSTLRNRGLFRKWGRGVSTKRYLENMRANSGKSRGQNGGTDHPFRFKVTTRQAKGAERFGRRPTAAKSVLRKRAEMGAVMVIRKWRLTLFVEFSEKPAEVEPGIQCRQLFLPRL